MGRPSSFTQEIADEICERLSNGEPLAAICRDEKMPGYRTVYDWQANDEAFSASIVRARDEGFDVIALEGLALLDEEPERVVTMMGDERSESRIDGASVQRAKNRFEGRLKLLSKWDPKRYGDKTLVGSDPDNPLPAGFQVNLVKSDATSSS